MHSFCLPFGVSILWLLNSGTWVLCSPSATSWGTSLSVTADAEWLSCTLFRSVAGSFSIVSESVVGENDGVCFIFGNISVLSQWYGLVFRHNQSSSKYEFTVRVWNFFLLSCWSSWPMLYVLTGGESGVKGQCTLSLHLSISPLRYLGFILVTPLLSLRNPKRWALRLWESKGKKCIKYIHQRWKGLEKGLEVGEDDGQAGGEESDKWLQNNLPKCSEVWNRHHDRSWSAELAQPPHKKCGSRSLSLSEQWGPLEWEDHRSSLDGTKKSMSQWSSLVRKSMV